MSEIMLTMAAAMTPSLSRSDSLDRQLGNSAVARSSVRLLRVDMVDLASVLSFPIRVGN